MCTPVSFSAPVSGLCYVPFTRLIWVASGTDSALLYDPKSGENVSLAAATNLKLYVQVSSAMLHILNVKYTLSNT